MTKALQSADESTMTSSALKQSRHSRTNEIDGSNIKDYIQSKIGMEPNAWGSKRRWQFLRTMARHIFEVKRMDFDSFFVWATAHCQCMKLRTLREDYLDTLERLGFVRVDWNNGFILWNGEQHG
jgi:hypothetical protein